MRFANHLGHAPLAVVPIISCPAQLLWLVWEALPRANFCSCLRHSQLAPCKYQVHQPEPAAHAHAALLVLLRLYDSCPFAHLSSAARVQPHPRLQPSQLCPDLQTHTEASAQWVGTSLLSTTRWLSEPLVHLSQQMHRSPGATMGRVRAYLKFKVQYGGVCTSATSILTANIHLDHAPERDALACTTVRVQRVCAPILYS